MSETRYFSGKVWQRSLPIFETLPESGAAPPRRLRLPQGELAQIQHADDVVKYLAYVELREGAVRGNHFHHAKQEFLYLIAGEAELILQDLSNGERVILAFRVGDLVRIDPNVAHALRPSKDGHAIEYSGTVYDATDTHRHPLV